MDKTAEGKHILHISALIQQTDVYQVKTVGPEIEALTQLGSCRARACPRQR